MSGTYSASESSTYTEARARYVLDKAWDDIVGLFCQQIITKQEALDWHRDIKHLLDAEALREMEFKVTYDGRTLRAWRYKVFADGSLSEDSESGGIDLSGLPPGSKAGVTVDLVEDTDVKEAALEYLRSQGWGTGAFLDVKFMQDRAFSKDGYGIRRSIYMESK